MDNQRNPPKTTGLPASPEQLRARLDLRRSNAAGLHKSKKAYSRKVKHQGKDSVN